VISISIEEPDPLDSTRGPETVGSGPVSKQKPLLAIAEGVFVVIVEVTLAPPSVTFVTEGGEMETVISSVLDPPPFLHDAAPKTQHPNNSIHPEDFMIII
jgi:hypothetical protein